MEGKRSGSQPLDLLKKIREFTRSILEDICCDGRSPLICIDRFRNYCTDTNGYCCCSSDAVKGKEIITVQREYHVRRLDVLLRVLLIVQQLLQENKHGSKRDIYYMHPSVFREQSVVDRAINDICILLQCSRHNLNVVSVGKGLVMGWLRFSEAGRKFDCISSPNSSHPVPVHVEEVKDIISVAEYILIVEKESAFQRLANDQFCKRNRCIVITGRGYPDVSTRRFLRLLVEKLCLPVYCLVDCDPYGFDILTTYRFGSMQMAYDAKYLRLPEIHWLGAFPSDIEKYSLPEQCLLPLTAGDKSRAEAILHRCYLQGGEVAEWRLELELLLQRGVKFEIEALSVRSLSFLSEEKSEQVDYGQWSSRRRNWVSFQYIILGGGIGAFRENDYFGGLAFGSGRYFGVWPNNFFGFDIYDERRDGSLNVRRLMGCKASDHSDHFINLFSSLIGVEETVAKRDLLG